MKGIVALRTGRTQVSAVQVLCTWRDTLEGRNAYCSVQRTPAFCAIFVQKALPSSTLARYNRPMSKLIRRTIIITITERWTFTWGEAQQTTAGPGNACANETAPTYQVAVTADEILTAADAKALDCQPSAPLCQHKAI